jgi:hypothetical protein
MMLKITGHALERVRKRRVIWNPASTSSYALVKVRSKSFKAVLHKGNLAGKPTMPGV